MKIIKGLIWTFLAILAFGTILHVGRGLYDFALEELYAQLAPGRKFWFVTGALVLIALYKQARDLARTAKMWEDWNRPKQILARFHRYVAIAIAPLAFVYVIAYHYGYSDLHSVFRTATEYLPVLRYDMPSAYNQRADIGVVSLLVDSVVAGLISGFGYSLYLAGLVYIFVHISSLTIWLSVAVCAHNLLNGFGFQPFLLINAVLGKNFDSLYSMGNLAALFVAVSSYAVRRFLRQGADMIETSITSTVID